MKLHAFRHVSHAKTTPRKFAAVAAMTDGAHARMKVPRGDVADNGSCVVEPAPSTRPGQAEQSADIVWRPEGQEMLEAKRCGT